MADNNLPPDLETGPICNVDATARTIRLGYVEARAETGAVTFPNDASGDMAFIILKAAQSLPATEGTPKPTRLLAPNSAAIAPNSGPGVIGLMFRFGDATVGVELNAESARQIGRGLISASERLRGE